MLRKLFPLAAAFLFLTPSLSLASEEKLDLILEELQALKKQVVALEERIAEMESIPDSVAMPTEQPKEKKRWIENMRVELKKADARARGPWTDPAIWQSVKVGMEEEEVLALLGEPTRRKFSIRKDTDEILIYEGDLEGTGELIEGEVRIYKGEVRRFVEPDFASE